MIDRITELKNKKVLIVGDIILDHYINVIPHKISEEAPLLVFNYNNEYYSLGGCANVAKYIASFKCSVDLVGVVGNDINANVVKDLLKDNKVNTKLIIKDNSIVTTTKTRLFSNDNKQVLRLDKEEASFDFKNIVVDEIKKLDNDYDLILVSDYNKGVITNDVLTEIIKLAKKNKTPIICDPKNYNLKYRDLLLLKPNNKEMNTIINNYNDKKIIEYKKENNIENIVLTLGKDGMKIYDKNNKIHNINAHECTVFDVTGAGDCVLSYLALGILSDMDFIDTCELANYAASIKVSKFGSEIVNIEEVISFFNKKIIPRKDLKTISNLLHKNNKIVFTNGCFDIIHSGHIHTLKCAKKEGDILILGLNSDSSIKKLKGPNRPILCEEERIEILTSLEYVDYIVVFDEETPLNIIKEIKPDVLVKGSDYRGKFIAGQKEVEAAGGKVVLVDLVSGKSTTNIIDRIKENNNE